MAGLAPATHAVPPQTSRLLRLPSIQWLMTRLQGSRGWPALCHGCPVHVVAQFSCSWRESSGGRRGFSEPCGIFSVRQIGAHESNELEEARTVFRDLFAACAAGDGR